MMKSGGAQDTVKSSAATAFLQQATQQQKNQAAVETVPNINAANNNKSNDDKDNKNKNLEASGGGMSTNSGKLAMSITLNPNLNVINKIMERNEQRKQQKEQESFAAHGSGQEEKIPQAVNNQQQQAGAGSNNTKVVPTAGGGMKLTLSPLSSYDPINGLVVSYNSQQPNESPNGAIADGIKAKPLNEQVHQLRQARPSSGTTARSSTSPGVDPLDVMMQRHASSKQAQHLNNNINNMQDQNSASMSQTSKSGLHIDGRNVKPQLMNLNAQSLNLGQSKLGNGGYSRSYLSGFAHSKNPEDISGGNVRINNTAELMQAGQDNQHGFSRNNNFILQHEGNYSSMSSQQSRGSVMDSFSARMETRGIPLDDDITLSSLQSAASSVRTNYQLRQGPVQQQLIHNSMDLLGGAGIPNNSDLHKLGSNNKSLIKKPEQLKPSYDDSVADPNVNRFSFPMKLHDMLARPEYSDILSWLPTGKAWIVINSKRLEKEVLRKYFRHGKFSSFSRQVNGWGFARVTSGKEKNAYYHELFLRDDPRQCMLMRRNYGTGGSKGNDKKSDISHIVYSKQAKETEDINSSSLLKPARDNRFGVDIKSSMDMSQQRNLDHLVKVNLQPSQQLPQIVPSQTQASSSFGTYNQVIGDNIMASTIRTPRNLNVQQNTHINASHFLSNNVLNTGNNYRSGVLQEFSDGNHQVAHLNTNPLITSYDHLRNEGGRSDFLPQNNVSVSNQHLLQSIAHLQNQQHMTHPISSVDTNNVPLTSVYADGINNQVFSHSTSGVGLNDFGPYEQLRQNFNGALIQNQYPEDPQFSGSSYQDVPNMQATFQNLISRGQTQPAEYKDISSLPSNNIGDVANDQILLKYLNGRQSQHAGGRMMSTINNEARGNEIRHTGQL